jgi:excisionase family DNA binding protein
VTKLSLPLPEEWLEAIAARAAELVAEQLAREASPWLTRTQAADYLGLPVSRLEKDRRIPCHRDGGRVLYHRDELDEHFRGLTSRP